ncbi:MAG: hypothetical protein IJY99_01440 [Alphaproteobacteria bacterium]|nr:hypothetical protein [Alphaproteobacteria bacterium]
MYKACLATLDANDKKYTDSMLYLAYIYLSDNEYQDIEYANQLIHNTMQIMASDCDGAHGTYDNFCYFEYFKDDVSWPEYFKNFDDAKHLFHMTLPCVHIGMIKENKSALELIEGHFGSSRDAAIASICKPFNPYEITQLRRFVQSPSFDELSKLNPEPPIDGTMSFTFSTSNYHDMIEMLTYPVSFFQDKTQDDLFIKLNFEEKKFFYAKDLLSELAKYDDLVLIYDAMVDNIKEYYTDALHMSEPDAIKYAKMTASSLILHEIFYR